MICCDCRPRAESGNNPDEHTIGPAVCFVLHKFFFAAVFQEQADQHDAKAETTNKSEYSNKVNHRVCIY